VPDDLKRSGSAADASMFSRRRPSIQPA